MPKGLKQCGHELAPGKVAGAAEQDEVKTHGVSVMGWFVLLRGIVITLHDFLKRSALYPLLVTQKNLLIGHFVV